MKTKENQVRKPKSVLPNSVKQTPANTQKDLAKAAGVGHDTIAKGKGFAPSEAVALGGRLEKLIKPEAEKRKASTQGRPRKGQEKTGAETAPVSKTRDAVGSAVGLSGRTYEKAKAVVEAAKDNPELSPVVEEMDRTGNVVDGKSNIHAVQTLCR